jgi:hypothetical protein
VGERCLGISVLAGLVVLGWAAVALAQPIRRVPAEFEPQEAVWLQWPGPFEKMYEPAYAEISNVIVQYEKLHILYDSNAIRNQARTAITDAGGDPDHAPSVWEWSFGDGGSSTEQNPVYTYAAEGRYSVGLTARSASGADTLIRTDYITVPEAGALQQLAWGSLFLCLLEDRRRRAGTG